MGIVNISKQDFLLAALPSLVLQELQPQSSEIARVMPSPVGERPPVALLSFHHNKPHHSS